MVRFRHRSKIKKIIEEIIKTVRDEAEVSKLLKVINEAKELAVKVSEAEQNEYAEYFEKYMNHKIRLLDIEQRKIELNYKEVIFRTDQQTAKFSNRLSEPDLTNDLREFYLKEYLNILKPQFALEQVLENYKNFMQVIKIIKEEFSEWFFLQRIDYLKQLLEPYFSLEKKKRKQKEVWLHKHFEKELSNEIKEKMFMKVKRLAKKT